MIVVRLSAQELAAGRVFWDRSNIHPGGEIFISAAGDHEVAKTPAVNRALSNGRLVEVMEATDPEPTTPVDATPSARKLAAKAGLDLASVKGTGKDGRITAGDVRRALEA
jgi:pyruvate/2-oxoglutarate dehydrogenase complex dihydrolipoamide acyltransferase (E2) component